MRRILFILLLSSLILPKGKMLYAGQGSPASWLEDWGANVVQTNPRNFEEDGARGASWGNYSARWPVSSAWRPINIQPPSISAGCGGIDVNMGGFEFDIGNKLKEKLEELIANSPTVALGIALSSMSEKLSNELAKANAAIDMLNSINLDSCKASQALVVSANDSIRAGSVNTDAWTKYAKDSGMATSFDKAMTAWKEKPEDIKTAIDNCPKELREIFTADLQLEDTAVALNANHPYKASFLRNLRVKYGKHGNSSNVNHDPSFTKELEELIRGLVGDVELEVVIAGQVPLRARILPPCDDNSASLSNNGINKIIPSPAFGTCDKDNPIDFDAYVKDKLVLIADAMSANSALGDDDKKFIQNHLDSLGLLALKVCTIEKNCPSEIENIAPLVARTTLINMVDDGLNRIENAYNKAMEIADKKKIAEAENTSCAVEFFEQSIEEVKKFTKQIRLAREQIIKTNFEMAAVFSAKDKAVRSYLDRLKDWKEKNRLGMQVE